MHSRAPPFLVGSSPRWSERGPPRDVPTVKREGSAIKFPLFLARRKEARRDQRRRRGNAGMQAEGSGAPGGGSGDAGAGTGRQEAGAGGGAGPRGAGRGGAGPEGVAVR